MTEISSTGRKGKAGVAALAGGAVLAVRNRDKLMALLARNRSPKEPGPSAAGLHPPVLAPGDADSLGAS